MEFAANLASFLKENAPAYFDSLATEVRAALWFDGEEIGIEVGPDAAGEYTVQVTFDE